MYTSGNGDGMDDGDGVVDGDGGDSHANGDALVAAEAEVWSGAQAVSWYPVFLYGDAGCLRAEGITTVKACGYVAH